MAEDPPITLVSTFIVRFWQEWSASGPCWRGRINHVQSGESATFIDSGRMLQFVQSLGVMIEGEACRGENLNEGERRRE